VRARWGAAGGALPRGVRSVPSAGPGAGVAAPAGTGPPRRTDLALVASGVADAERVLRADARLLGLDPGAVDAVFAGTPGTHVRRTLTGHGTAVFEVAAVVEVTLGQPGGVAAAISYRLS